MSANRNLHKAKSNKKDEFYTQLVDIENELKHYRQHFRDKVVYCNCDDPRVSNFFYFFYHNFSFLGLKRLITTCYKNQNPDIFSQHDNDSAVCLQYDGSNLLPDTIELKGDGDFRSPECIELLRRADIVVTNPPFSLFREYVAQLIEYDKKFLIIGNMNALTYKEFFPLIKSNKVWLGYAQESRTMLFNVPPDAVEDLRASKKEGSTYTIVNGEFKIRTRNAKWFTNLDHKKRHEELILYKRYSPEEYPHYDNYDAINVDKTKDIPEDYAGAMGVPISFLDKHNPDQFEILSANDIRADGSVPFKAHGLIKDKDGAINGKPKYVRIVIRNKRLQQ